MEGLQGAAEAGEEWLRAERQAAGTRWEEAERERVRALRERLSEIEEQQGL